MKMKSINRGDSFLESSLKIFVLVGAGILFAIALSAFVTHDLIDALQQRISSPVLILYAEIIGFVSPGPRYIIYPFLVKLKDFGLGAGVIVALISGHVLIEPSTAFVEAAFFGYKFPVKRFFISFVLVFLLGLFTVFLTDYVGWRIL